MKRGAKATITAAETICWHVDTARTYQVRNATAEHSRFVHVVLLKKLWSCFSKCSASMKSSPGFTSSCRHSILHQCPSPSANKLPSATARCFTGEQSTCCHAPWFSWSLCIAELLSLVSTSEAFLSEGSSFMSTTSGQTSSNLRRLFLTFI